MGGDSANYAITALFITFSVLGFFSSLTVLILIRVMKKWNGYLAIICFSLYNIKTGHDNFIWVALQFFGGISSSIFTNILSFVVLYVVFKMSSFDIMGNFTLFKTLAIVPATLFLILRCVYIDHEQAEQYIFDFYYYVRFASILFNFLAFIVISRRTYWYKTKNTGVNKSSIELAINVLATRMIYYPILQAVSILPAAVYESVVSIHKQNPTSSGGIALDVIFAVLTPSTGIGYLIIFLVMQPNAYKHFRSLLTTGKPYRPPNTDSDAAYETGSTGGSVEPLPHMQHAEEGEGVGDSKAGRPTPNEIYRNDFRSGVAAAKSTDGSHHTGVASGGGSSGFNIHNYNRDSDTASWVDSMQYLEEDELIDEINGGGTDSARSSRTVDSSPHLSTSPGSGHNTKHLSWINFKRSKPLTDNIEL